MVVAAPIGQFYGLIDEIKIAMMATRRPDGHLLIVGELPHREQR